MYNYLIYGILFIRFESRRQWRTSLSSVFVYMNHSVQNEKGRHMTEEQLIKIALEAREKSYSPYSGYKVGAALLTAAGKVYTGCNIENASYTPTNCAERTAFFKAVSEGERSFEAIAGVGGKGDKPTDYAWPCGVCRQVMREFCNPETFQIILAKSETEYHIYKLKELLPLGFGPEDLI